MAIQDLRLEEDVRMNSPCLHGEMWCFWSVIMFAIAVQSTFILLFEPLYMNVVVLRQHNLGSTWSQRAHCFDGLGATYCDVQLWRSCARLQSTPYISAYILLTSHPAPVFETWCFDRTYYDRPCVQGVQVALDMLSTFFLTFFVTVNLEQYL